MAIELDGLYESFLSSGLTYEGAFRGLLAAYRRGDELYAEVKLPESVSKDAPNYGLHPALLDAALHVLALQGGAGEVALPFAWQGVRLHATGASALRVKVTMRGPHQASLLLADETGELVGKHRDAAHAPGVGGAGACAAEQLGDALYRVDWVAVESPAVGSSAEPVSWALLGADVMAQAWSLPAPSAQYADIAQLSAALDAGVAAARRWSSCRA